MSRAGAKIDIRGVSKKYGPVAAVRDVEINIRPGEFVTLLGPSGSGKTSILNLIAGYTDVSSGQIYIDEKRVDALPPNKRNIGTVFQSYALFPHMTAFQNVMFPLNQRPLKPDERRETATKMLALVEMAGFGARYPHELSGGQQQRIALARALVFQPAVLLLDEPLSALDRKLRETLQIEIRRLQRSTGTTCIFVTHDQEEALALSDRIAIFEGGQVRQIGTGRELYENPASLFVAQFLGESIILKGDTGVDGSTSGTFKSGPHTVRARPMAGGRFEMLMVRPENADLVPLSFPTTGLNAIPVTVGESTYLGAYQKCEIRLPDGGRGVVRLAASRPMMESGTAAQLTWNPDHSVLLSA